MSAVSLQERDPRILKEGLQKNVRFVGDDIPNAVPILQIDPKKSAFFPPIGVVEYLEQFLHGHGPLMQRLQNPVAFRQAHAQLKRLIVTTTHRPRAQHIFALAGLSMTPPRDQVFPHPKLGPITVERYFDQAYNHRLGVSAGLPVSLFGCCLAVNSH